MGCGTNNTTVTDKSQAVASSRTVGPPKGTKKETIKYENGRVSPLPKYADIGKKLEPLNSVAFGVLSTLRPRRAGLSETQQRAIDAIAVAASKFQTYAEINVTREQLPAVIDCFANDFPEVFWVVIKLSYVNKEGIVLRVDFDKFDQHAVSKRFNQIKDICSKVLEAKAITSPFLACYEELLTVQIVSSGKDTADFALVERQATKLGLARALQLLLLKCDIPAVSFSTGIVAFNSGNWATADPSQKLTGINAAANGTDLEGITTSKFTDFPEFCSKKFGRYAAILASQNHNGKLAQIIVKSSASAIEAAKEDFVSAIQAVGTGHPNTITVTENASEGICEICVKLGDGELKFEVK